MKLIEQFENVEMMFENQIGKLKYDELCEASNECAKIADEFAVGFAEFLYDCALDETLNNKSLNELLEIYKKEKNL